MNLEQLKAAAQAVVDAESAINNAIIALSADAFDEIVEQRKRTLAQAIYALGKALKNDLETSCGWQPIETAPKDARILVYTDDTQECFVVSHMTCVNDGSQEWVCARIDNGAIVIKNPTHWMPVPAAPTGGVA